MRGIKHCPWRSVTTVSMHEGLVSPILLNQDRYARYWILTLDCGHEVERLARYHPKTPGWVRDGASYQRNTEDLRPAPRRVRCYKCKC